MSIASFGKMARACATPRAGATVAAAGAALFALAAGRPEVLALMIGVGLAALYASGVVVALLCAAAAGAVATLLQPVWEAATAAEGFTDGGSDAAEEAPEGVEEDADKPEEKHGAAPAKRRAGAPPPDNRDRREMLELGAPYKVPREDEDGEFHLDAGSTMLNAYKALRPEQLAAMSKDTRDLMDTQKQLMDTLRSLKPLMADGKEMMDTFSKYFGAGAAGTS